MTADKAWIGQRNEERRKKYGDRKVGQRPSVKECLQAWQRFVGLKATRVKPTSGTRRGGPPDAWDAYCADIVAMAASKVGSPTTAGLLLRIASHSVYAGSLEGFKLLTVIAVSPSRVQEHKQIQVPGSMPQMPPEVVAGIELYIMLMAMNKRFQQVLQEAIDGAEAFIAPAEEV